MEDVSNELLQATIMSEEAHLVSLLLDAIETVVDADTRREYEEAMELAPMLVRKETNAIDFLRTDNHDPLRGAVRLALYWKYRKALFGERWLRPMTQSGRGALDASDVELLHTGYMFVIPRPNQGPLLMMDPSKLPRTAAYSGTRILFYLFTVFTDYYSTTDGITSVVVVSSSYSKRPPIATEKNVVHMGVTALPLRVKGFHIVRTHEFGKEILLETYAYNEGRVYQYQTGLTPELVAGDSVKGVLESMHDRGVQRMYLPQVMGGDFAESHFHDWVRMRLSIEDILQGLPTTTTTLNKTFFPSYAVAMIDSQNSKKQQSSEKLRLHNQPEHDRTLDLPAAAADSEIPTQRPGESRKDFLRRRNTYYVRRGARKITQQISSLRQEVGGLEQRNQVLRDSNRRLEASLAQARLVVALSNSGSGCGGT